MKFHICIMKNPRFNLFSNLTKKIKKILYIFVSSLISVGSRFYFKCFCEWISPPANVYLRKRGAKTKTDQFHKIKVFSFISNSDQWIEDCFNKLIRFEKFVIESCCHVLFPQAFFYCGIVDQTKLSSSKMWKIHAEIRSVSTSFREIKSRKLIFCHKKLFFLFLARFSLLFSLWASSCCSYIR